MHLVVAGPIIFQKSLSIFNTSYLPYYTFFHLFNFIQDIWEIKKKFQLDLKMVHKQNLSFSKFGPS